MNNDPINQAEQLLKLALSNKSKKIYNILNTLRGSTKYKGDVFEHFLAGLYNGTGCTAKVVGGKNDQGVDILLYHPSESSKVQAIIQSKNLKMPLPKREMRHEYANFFGDNFSSQKGSSEKYNCQKLYIISLNGYTYDAKNFTNPKKTTHTVHCNDWNDVKKLIRSYSNKRSTDKVDSLIVKIKHFFKITIESEKKFFVVFKRIFIPIVIVIFIIFIFIFTFFFVFISHSSETLTDEMIVRLQKTKLTNARKRDCQNFNYPFETCSQQLVDRYAKIYGKDSLKIGLIVYYCGEGNFKKKKSGCKIAERHALYVLTGKQ
jgi:hypothetical protein